MKYRSSCNGSRHRNNWPTIRVLRNCSAHRGSSYSFRNHAWTKWCAGVLPNGDARISSVAHAPSSTAPEPVTPATSASRNGPASVASATHVSPRRPAMNASRTSTEKNGSPRSHRTRGRYISRPRPLNAHPARRFARLSPSAVSASTPSSPAAVSTAGTGRRANATAPASSAASDNPRIVAALHRTPQRRPRNSRSGAADSVSPANKKPLSRAFSTRS